eukprot:TRINITY_DN1799_c0_g1_i2.p2 TRINITY_DN1799_c0_g1~~TRINITY_DN1799_c0_g1_i2.p2  ORF type:complete len:265 (+),score=47.20 TRINITY_DN1799_c0_g1_i2:1252-2046(+)
MSRRKRVSTAGAAVEDDGQPMAKEAKSFTSDAAREEAIRRVARFIIFKHAAGANIKKPDIVKLFPQQSSKTTAWVMKEAAQIVENTFGLKLQELPKGEDRKNLSEPRVQTANANTRPEIHGGTNSFILVNKLATETLPRLCDWGKEKQRYGVMMTILAEIYLRKHTISAHDLWSFLEDIGLPRQTEHAALGIISTFIDQLVAEKFLTKLKITQTGNGESVEHYRWGQRARAELSQKDIVKFMADIHGQDGERSWQQLGREDNED